MTSSFDSNSGLLTKKFINLLKHAKDGILDLNKAADTLEVSSLCSIYGISLYDKFLSTYRSLPFNRCRKGVYMTLQMSWKELV